MDAETLDISVKGPVLHVKLNRPDVHNAFNTAMIEELSSLFLELPDRDGVRAVVVSGNGPSFCAGADIKMMRRAGEATIEENRQDAVTLAGLFHSLKALTLRVVCRVDGAALGGGMGLVACCDVVVADSVT